MNNDFDRIRLGDISRFQLNDLLVDKVEELHLDCGLKMDASIVQHTVKKILDLLSLKYKSWCWGEFTDVCKQGITGVYGSTAFKINFQMLATWMKKAEAARGSMFAGKNISENENFKKHDADTDYKKNAKNWGPLMYLRFDYGLKFSTPADLKKAIENDQIPGLAKQSLQEKYPYVLTVGYPL